MLQNQTIPETAKLSEARQRPPNKSWWTAFFEPTNPIAYLPIVLAAIILFFGATWQFYRPYTDIGRYQCYAVLFWTGSNGFHFLTPYQCKFIYGLGMPFSPQPAFHILPFEYPPLTLALFSLGLLAPVHYYPQTFAILMALTALLTYFLLLRYGPRGGALLFAVLLTIGCLSTAEARFDIVPALLTLLCLIAADRKHWTTAYIALAFGVLLKIYPLLLLPALFIAEQIDAQRFHVPPARLKLTSLPKELWQTLGDLGYWRWKNTLIFFALIVGVTGCFALLNYQGAIVSQLTYFAKRPIQIESTGSTLLWLGRHLGDPVHITLGFGSVNLVSKLSNKVSLLLGTLFVGGYTLTILWQWRRKLNLTHTFLALILVFVVMGKVFSPQYLMWMIPLLAYSGAFNWISLSMWTAIAALTTYIFPYLYLKPPTSRLLLTVPGFVSSIALRNGLLLFITVAFIFNWLGFTWPPKESPPPMPDLLADDTRLLPQ